MPGLGQHARGSRRWGTQENVMTTVAPMLWPVNTEIGVMSVKVNPNPPKDTDGRREGSGRGWVRELQGRWPGVLG